jgi:hypothetical protein
MELLFGPWSCSWSTWRSLPGTWSDTSAGCKPLCYVFMQSMPHSVSLAGGPCSCELLRSRYGTQRHYVRTPGRCQWQKLHTAAARIGKLIARQQRGTNEYTNRLLRRYLPNGTDLSLHTQAHLDRIALRLNQRPRETLGLRAPADKLRESIASTR